MRSDRSSYDTNVDMILFPVLTSHTKALFFLVPVITLICFRKQREKDEVIQIPNSKQTLTLMDIK